MPVKKGYRQTEEHKTKLMAWRIKKKLIRILKTLHPCLNCNRLILNKYFCSYSCKYKYPVSEKTRSLMSVSGQKKKLTEEHKNKIGSSCKGRSAWNKGLNRNTDSRLAQIGDKLMGRPLSLECRQKISEKGKGRQPSQKSKYKLIQYNKTFKSQEMKEKLVTVFHISREYVDSLRPAELRASYDEYNINARNKA